MINYKNLPWLNNDSFRNEETGKFITESYFLELQQTNPHLVKWCLTEWEKEFNGQVLPSAHMTIVHANDEYDAAMKICGSWHVWGRLKRNKRMWNGVVGMFPGLAIALEEQKMRKAAEAYRLLEDSAINGNVAAQRYLHEQSKESKAKGRKPPKQDSKEKDQENVVQLLNKIKLPR